MSQAPPTRRTFSSPADERDYLSEKISYWWHERGRRSEALRFCSRLEKLLGIVAAEDESIVVAEYRSLLHEVRRDLQQAIRFRKREVTLLQRLLEIGGPVGPVDYQYLADTLVLLGSLYAQSGNKLKAIEAVREAEELAALHALSFIGEDMLRDLEDGRGGAESVDARRPA